MLARGVGGVARQPDSTISVSIEEVPTVSDRDY
jgi:hypothetical protein